MTVQIQGSLLVLQMIFWTSFGWNIPSVLIRRKSFGIGPTAAVGAGVMAAGAAIYVHRRSKQITEYTPARNSLRDQTIFITGASTGLGLESAKRLAAGGANVILTARSDSKGQAAVQEVLRYLSQRGMEVDEQSQKIGYKVLDLDDLLAIREAVSSWTDVTRIDVLINNAGVMAIPHYQLTEDGLERQIQSNHLGHFLLTSLLLPKFSSDARIVNVSSEAHKFASKGLDLHYIWGSDSNAETYGPWKSYGQSKLANLLFTQELQRRSDAAGLNWTVVSLHPGAVATDLGRNLLGTDTWNKLQHGNGSWWQTSLFAILQLFVTTVEQGATTQVWLASRADETDMKGGSFDSKVKGEYFIDCKARSLQGFASDPVAAGALWSESETKAGTMFSFLKEKAIES